MKMKEVIQGKDRQKPTQAFGHPIMKEFSKIQDQSNQSPGFQESKNMSQISSSIKEKENIPPIMEKFSKMQDQSNQSPGFQESKNMSQISSSIKEKESVQFISSQLPVNNPDSVPRLSLSERIRQRIEREEEGVGQ